MALDISMTGGQPASGGASNGFDMNKFMNMMKMFGIGSGAGTAAGGAFNFFNAGKNNPSDAAKPYLDQIPGVGGKYLQPFVDNGAEAGKQLGGQYENLLNDTGSVYDKLSGGYKESPGYKHRLDTALGAGSSAAAAGGMLGTPMHEEQNMTLANDIAGQDFDKYMGNMMDLYGKGITGEQSMFNTGANASNNLADMLASALTQQGTNAFNGQANKNTSKSQGMTGMMQGLMQILPFLFM
jgi:hypothetical protein